MERHNSLRSVVASEIASSSSPSQRSYACSACGAAATFRSGRNAMGEEPIGPGLMFQCWPLYTWRYYVTRVTPPAAGWSFDRGWSQTWKVEAGPMHDILRERLWRKLE